MPHVTEADWLGGGDLVALVKHLRGRASERKLRLFACACCRRLWHLLGDARSRAAVEMAERYADGLATEVELAAVHVEAGAAVPAQPASWSAASHAAYLAFVTAAAHAPYAARQVAGGVPWGAGARRELLREVIGNPFRPARLDPAWLCWDAGTVRRLALGIYEERAFERLPVLGDALEEAGCADETLLAHCRGGALHVRGCWLVDLLLGKD
jgi:hypothetical protein